MNRWEMPIIYMTHILLCFIISTNDFLYVKLLEFHSHNNSVSFQQFTFTTWNLCYMLFSFTICYGDDIMGYNLDFLILSVHYSGMIW